MPINIKGNQYVTVAERVKAIHDSIGGAFSLNTEVLKDEPVVIKATLTIGEYSFTGISAANPSKQIEKMSPYEVAETSAVGRALGFAGYGLVDSIASADEMNKVGDVADYGNCKNCGAPNKWSVNKNKAYCSKLCWKNPDDLPIKPEPKDDFIAGLEEDNEDWSAKDL